MSMTIQSSVKDKILATSSETSKVENAPAEMLHDLDQQMEKRDDGSLYFLDRIWVPLVGDVRITIMDEAHKSKYSVHPGADKMYYDLRDMYWWPGMKPEWKWDKITMDFITKLPRSKNGHDTIWVIVKEGGREFVLYGSYMSSVKAAESVRDAIGFEYYLAILKADGQCRTRSGYAKSVALKGVIRFGKKGKLAPSLHVPLDEIKVDKTLRFVEEPVENSDRKAKWLAVRYLVKVSWNSKCNFELTWVWEDYLKDKFDNQSIERDRLIGIGFVLDFVEFISFTFGDKEMISVIEAVYVDDIIFGFTKKSLCDQFEELFSDSDYAGASLDKKSTTGGCQFLRRRLISWQCKKQTIVANSTMEVEYVAAANCCGQTVYKEWEDRMERAATTASSLEAEQDSGSGPRCQVTILGLQMLKLGLRLHLNSPMIHLSQELTHLEVGRTGEKEMRDIVSLKTERELVRINIDDGNAFYNEIEVNAVTAVGLLTTVRHKLMLLGKT
ncbi:putative reverse transcriptase domain-containing protein [Tanacetum coccineum]